MVLRSWKAPSRKKWLNKKAQARIEERLHHLQPLFFLPLCDIAFGLQHAATRHSLRPPTCRPCDIAFSHQHAATRHSLQPPTYRPCGSAFDSVLDPGSRGFLSRSSPVPSSEPPDEVTTAPLLAPSRDWNRVCGIRSGTAAWPACRGLAILAWAWVWAWVRMCWQNMAIIDSREMLEVIFPNIMEIIGNLVAICGNY